MGLFADLKKAKEDGLRLSMQGLAPDIIDKAIQKAQPVLTQQSEDERDAIINFLKESKFRITQLNANVVLEDFNIPQQPADIQSTVQYITPAGTPSSLILPPPPAPSVLTKALEIDKDSTTPAGILDSTGYVFIGADPGSQENFDVTTEQGQKYHTTVEFFVDDNEGIL